MSCLGRQPGICSSSTGPAFDDVVFYSIFTALGQPDISLVRGSGTAPFVDTGLQACCVLFKRMTLSLDRLS
jgi:hypothetical protein